MAVERREGLEGGSADEISVMFVVALFDGGGGRRFAARVVVFVGIVVGSCYKHGSAGRLLYIWGSHL